MEEVEQPGGDSVSQDAVITDTLVGIFGTEMSVVLVLVLKKLYEIHKDLKARK
jgi:hypothetical protein